MRYLRDWFFLSICVALPILLGATLAIWVRGYFVGDFLALHRREPQGGDSTGLSVANVSGRMGVWYWRRSDQLTPGGVWHFRRSVNNREPVEVAILDDALGANG